MDREIDRYAMKCRKTLTETSFHPDSIFLFVPHPRSLASVSRQGSNIQHEQDPLSRVLPSRAQLAVVAPAAGAPAGFVSGAQKTRGNRGAGVPG
jgi:hypothetical protein